MPNRPAKFAAAIFVSLLTGTSLATLSSSAARAADDCLTAPKGETPGGSHWYYRIEHATKRHCWYLREQGEKLSQAVPPNSPRAAKPMVPAEETPTRSIADAHAELPAQTDIAGSNRNVAPIVPMPADAVVRESDAGAEPPRSVIASRWPEPSGVSAAASLRPAARDLAANLQPDSIAAPPRAAAAVTLAAADSSSQPKTSSIPLLLSAVSGALALAGITASVVLKFAGQRPPRQGRLRLRRDAIFEATDDDRIVLSADADALPRRTGFARDFDRGGDADDRIAEFFGQLSRRTPS